jgi:hypothetical protein
MVLVPPVKKHFALDLKKLKFIIRPRAGVLLAPQTKKQGEAAMTATANTATTNFVHITVGDVARLKSEVRAMEEFAFFVAWLQPMSPAMLAHAAYLFGEQAYADLHGLVVPPAERPFFLSYLQDYLEGRSLDEIRQSILAERLED